MSKSTFAVIIMAIAMIALLAFGGTYAYFTASSNAQADTTTQTGKIALTATGDIFTATLTEKVLPGERLFGEGEKTVAIKDSSNRRSYIFIQLSVKAYKATNTTQAKADHVFSSDLTGTDFAFEGATLAAVPGHPGVYYFVTTAENTDTQAVAADETYTLSGAGVNVQIPTAWANDMQDATIKVEIKVQSIQYATFGDNKAQEAYEAIETPNATTPDLNPEA